jgi:formylglycine-generating enzyme required for sulfatase activity
VIGGAAAISLLLIAYLVVLWRNPRLLLRLPSGITIPKTALNPEIKLAPGIVAWLKYRPRVLDAWVAERIKKAQANFEGRETVKARQIYLPAPIRLSDEKLTGLTVKDLQAALKEKQTFRVVIHGEGGVGKTSLACQIAKWAMAEGKEERLCQQHRMLPILIEEELEEGKSLFDAITFQLRKLRDEPEAIAEELLKQLLEKQRILVIVDHLSEMSEATRKAVQLKDAHSPVNALIVTSRLPDILGREGPVTSLEPEKISVNNIIPQFLAYLQERLKQEEKTQLEFSNDDYTNAQRILGDIAGVREAGEKGKREGGVTFLLIKLYVDLMIAQKKGALTEIAPNNVPDLMLGYVRELNQNVASSYRAELGNRDLTDIVQFVAWQCVESTFKPDYVQKEKVRQALEELATGTEKPQETATHWLNYLETRLKIVTPSYDQKTLRLSLDPLAEYLAGLHLVWQYRNDEVRWRKLIQQAATKPLDEIRGFLLALRDCCEKKRKQAEIPDFVVPELGRLADLDVEAIAAYYRERRLQILKGELSNPVALVRLRTVEELGGMGQDAAAMIPLLQDILKNDDENKVRQAAAKALNQLGDRSLLLIAEVIGHEIALRYADAPQIEHIDLGNQIYLDLVPIPGGTFVMGSPPEEYESGDSERPQHEVTIQPFSMGRYPVTQAQWRVVAALDKVERDLEPNPSTFKGDDRPVENVSWWDAIEFCARLSQKTGQEFRLPSEAEWEYACRAVTSPLFKGGQGGSYPPFHFGETLSVDVANYNGNDTYRSGSPGIFRGSTTPVGEFGVANAFGLYDMHGNVWEWCADDFHNNYEGAPIDGSIWKDNDNRSQKEGTGKKILRGGSWNDTPWDCRSAYRLNISPRGLNTYRLGFRVVRAASRTS